MTNINFTEKKTGIIFLAQLAEFVDKNRESTNFLQIKTWFSAGVEEGRNLLDKDDNFLSYNAFEYHKVIFAMTGTKKVCSPALGDTGKVIENLLSHSKICKKIDQHLIEKKAPISSKSRRK